MANFRSEVKRLLVKGAVAIYRILRWGLLKIPVVNRVLLSVEWWLRRVFKMNYLYVLWTPEMPYRFKAGISTDVIKRMSQIEFDLSEALGRKVVVYRAFSMPVILADQYERKIHEFLRWLGLQYNGLPRKVSGYTEFFWFVNVLSMLGATSLMYWKFEFDSGYALLIFLAPFPLDAALLALAVCVVEILLFLAVVVSSCWYFFFSK